MFTKDITFTCLEELRLVMCYLIATMNLLDPCVLIVSKFRCSSSNLSTPYLQNNFMNSKIFMCKLKAWAIILNKDSLSVTLIYPQCNDAKTK